MHELVPGLFHWTTFHEGIQGLKDAFRGLLTRDFDHLLFAHGDPLVGGGKSALRDFVERPVGMEDYGQTV